MPYKHVARSAYEQTLSACTMLKLGLIFGKKPALENVYSIQGFNISEKSRPIGPCIFFDVSKLGLCQKFELNEEYCQLNDALDLYPYLQDRYRM